MVEGVADPVAKLAPRLRDARVSRPAGRAGVATILDERNLGIARAEHVFGLVVDLTIETAGRDMRCIAKPFLLTKKSVSPLPG